jgi:endo-1,4-beta-xylanase
LAWPASRRLTSNKPSVGRTLLIRQHSSFYNDGEAESLSPKSDAIYAMVRDFKRRGVPIDGFGLQMHIFDLKRDIEGVSSNIARFTALGVQVHITQMDVALPLDADGNARPTDLARQAEIYRRVASACPALAGCNAIQTWGFSDKYSWIGSKTKGAKGSALPFDRKYAPKPAYEALRSVLTTGKRAVPRRSGKSKARFPCGYNDSCPAKLAVRRGRFGRART